MVDLSPNSQFRVCSTNLRTENSFNRCQSEKKKTALTDANRKKENSFNRCQSEKTNFKKISFQRNSTIRRFGFPNDAIFDCIWRFGSLTIFRLRPSRIKCEQHYSSENTFRFLMSINCPTLIKADGTFVICTQRESTRRHTQRRTSSYEKVNNEDSQLKKEKWDETIQNQLSYHKQILKKKTKAI